MDRQERDLKTETVHQIINADLLPIEPDYSIFDYTSNNTGTQANPSPDFVCVNISNKPGKEVLWLVLAAAGLLLLVMAALFIILTKGAVITNSNGKLSLLFGKPMEFDPFILADVDDDVLSSEADLLIDIKDPPMVSTESVASEGELSISQIAQKVRPSVVSIIANKGIGSKTGSGVILSSDGYIVTNHHIISDSINFDIITNNGNRLEGVVIGYDKNSDLAVVKIEANDLTPAVFGNSDALMVGDLAVAIGTPYHLSLMGTTTSGIISAINRNVVINNRPMSLLQTDATIGPGSSGGPLINKFGQIIGITSASIGDIFDGIGFAIPMNTAKDIIVDLITHGYVPGHPTIGVSGHFLTQLMAEAYGLPMGLYITGVHTGSDAYLQGIRIGDVITTISGFRLADLPALYTAISSSSTGEAISLLYYRDKNLADHIPGTYHSIMIVLMDENELK